MKLSVLTTIYSTHQHDNRLIMADHLESPGDEQKTSELISFKRGFGVFKILSRGIEKSSESKYVP